MDSKLSPLQQRLLDAFFALEQRFFLTGGAALAGYHLGHRSTADLDLFATENILEDGDSALLRASESIGATVERLQTSATFRRMLVRRGHEGVLVDLVLDSTHQGFPEKLRFGSVRVDPASEIMANKLCTLLARGEIRDIVDVMELEAAGHRVEECIALAQAKDSGLSPAQLAWVLSQIRISDDARIPGSHTPQELRTFLERLQSRLAQAAFPSDAPRNLEK